MRVAAALAAAATMQSVSAPHPVDAPATADRTAPTAPAAAPSLQDRVATLVGQGRCAEAKDEANAGGDGDLASQVDQLCGLGSPSANKTGGGHGRGGGGGRRGGSSGG